MKRMKKVVGIAFIKDGKLLISQSVKSSKEGKFTFVGGGVEEGESLLQAAVRECHEEIQNGFHIDESDFEYVMNFIEEATSDPNLSIDMTIFLAKKDIDVELLPNEEILEYRWYNLRDDDQILSRSIKDHFIPWAKEHNLMY